MSGITDHFDFPKKGKPALKFLTSWKAYKQVVFQPV